MVSIEPKKRTLLADKSRRRPRIGRLTSTARVGCEIGRLYRAMRCGELSTTDGYRMLQTLIALKSCLEGGAGEGVAVKVGVEDDGRVQTH